ncbi:MAG: hypothetical protein J6B87_04285 [Clostridia bacterium]|nr:hypothetical protein [Clostridia bacterium]
MIEDKIQIIKQLDNYDARYVIKVLQAYKSRQSEYMKLKNESNIILKSEMDDYLENIIDLDEIWADKYLYTRMRLKLDDIVKSIDNIDIKLLEKNPNKILKKIVLKKIKKCAPKGDEKIDIVDFIKKLENENLADKEYKFIANKIDEESIFKELQLRKAIEIIRIKDEKNRISKIYDEMCDYLNKDFIANNYCDFKDNKCIAQRKHQFYPINKKNGCCYKMMRGCDNLVNGKCKIECIACRLFACDYLRKRGVGYWGDEFILLKSFLTIEQRRHFIFDFYESKEQIISKMDR